MVQQYSSALLEKAVGEFSKLPGIGRKTALRLVLFMLRREEGDVDQFVDAIARMKREVKYCRVCHNISDTEVCPICSDPRRDASVICVVENVQDVLAVENTQQFHGLYHVLGGIISPMDGIGPADLEIDSLVQRVAAPRSLSDWPMRILVLRLLISIGNLSCRTSKTSEQMSHSPVSLSSGTRKQLFSIDSKSSTLKKGRLHFWIRSTSALVNQ